MAVAPTLAGRIAYDPPLPGYRDQLTQRMPLGTVAKCMAIYDEPFWRAEGLSGQGTSDARPGPADLRQLAAGRLARRAARLPRGPPRARARPPAGGRAPDRRDRLLHAPVRAAGGQAPDAYVERLWAEEEWTRGCYGCHMPTGAWTNYGPALRAPIGPLHWAGAEYAHVWNGYMDGAVRSGETAAAEVVDSPVAGYDRFPDSLTSDLCAPRSEYFRRQAGRAKANVPEEEGTAPMKTPRFLALIVATAMLAIAGCGGDDDEGGGAPDAKKATQAKASGNVTWCIGKDTSGAFGTVIDAFNKANPDANVKLLELPEDAGEQRRLQVQRLRAKSPECDVLGMDVIWTAEYAAQGWLLDVSRLHLRERRQVHPVDRGHHRVRGQELGGPVQLERGLHLLPQRRGQAGADGLGGRSTRRPRRATASSTRASGTRA